MKIAFQAGQGLTIAPREGLRKVGLEVADEIHPNDNVVACWGWRVGLSLMRKGRNVLVFERGYLGDRFHWTSAAWNGLNGKADFCVPKGVEIDRFKENFELKPWKEEGDFIVIMGQIQGDMSIGNADLTRFYEDLADRLWIKYNKPVFFRPHPHARDTRQNFQPRIQPINIPLKDVLDRAYLIATYNSNSGVDAVVNGVPALSFDYGSMAYEVTAHENCARITPDRTDWAAKLAYCQWSPEEIQTGAFWEQLKCKVEN